MTTQTNSEVLPTNVRLWVYSALHRVMSQLNEADVNMDIQLSLEVALDQMVSRRLLPNETLGYDIKQALHIWQDNARNGYELYDVLEHWVPTEEREVFKDVSHETLNACFTTALMLIREEQEDNSVAEESPAIAPTPDAPSHGVALHPTQPLLPTWVVVLWPISIVVSVFLGVYLGSGL